MEEKNRGVTVVVPVYNVERYLERCLESIIHQTVQASAVILIDDGSTDRSGLICDEYAKKYDYISVIHKENGGLSDARNHSYAYVETEYVTFIDSDDYIDECYVAKAVDVLKSCNADIVAMGTVQESEEQTGDNIVCSGDIYEMDTEEAINELCYNGRIGTSACGKLFRIDSLRRNPFPKGKTYEDLATVYKLIGEAKKIVTIDIKPYHYVHRLGSIRHSRWNATCYDVIEATEYLKEYVRKEYPQCMQAVKNRYYLSANEVYVRAFNEEQYLEIIGSIRKKLREYWVSIMVDKRIKNMRKIQYTFMAYLPRGYRFMYNIIKNHN